MAQADRPKRGLRDAANWLGDREPVLLVAFLLLIGGAWGFIALADEVGEGETEAFDRWAVRATAPAGGPDRADRPSMAAGDGT